MIRRWIAPLLALLAPPALAQTAPAPVTAAPATTPADPALWVVKDKDTTIYLFGTIHVLKPGMGWFDSAVKKAFDSSGTLVLEMVQPDPATMQALVLRLGLTASGPTLTEKLPAAERPAYAKALTDNGLPAAALDRAKPWMAAVNLGLLPIMKLGYDLQEGPEHVLAAAAEAQHKPVVGLETAEQQLGIFDQLPEPVQVKFLESTVRDLPKTQTEIEAMVGDWAKGDPDALARLINDDIDEQPELAKVLLADRNARWADWIDARMKQPGTVFIAVGAGHLAGPLSVQNQLAKHNLVAERIRY